MKVLCTNGLKTVMLELAPHFEGAIGTKPVMTWGSAAGLVKELDGGTAADLVILTAEAIEELIARGKVVPGSRVDLAKSGVGVGVKSGAPKPDISTTEALKKTILAARSIGYSTGPSGVYVTGLFQRLGVADEIKGRLKQTPTGVFVGSIIASGEAEIGFQQISELSHFAGVDYVGPLPADVQQFTMFSSGIIVGAKDADGAKALVKFITAPAAAAAFKKRGMEPG